MTLSPTSRVFSKTSPSRLGTYLATAVGSCGLATSADAAIVNIDISPMSGVNGGVPSDSNTSFIWTPGGRLEIYNRDNYFGLDADSLYVSDGNGTRFYLAINGGDASPKNLGAGDPIDGNLSFSKDENETLFLYYSSISPNFGANSYMAFKVEDIASDVLQATYYGWIEVTWNSAKREFAVLSAAYESTPDTAILAGAAAPVPEPSTGALAALVLGGAALGVARRRRKQEAAATSEQAV